MADDGFALGVIAGLLIGIFVGLPCGWVLAQALKSRDGSIVTLERDTSGRVTTILEKTLS